MQQEAKPRAKSDADGWGRDIVSGTVVSLVSLAYCLSFALLIFAGPLAQGLSFGISAALVSAGICSLIVATGSSFARAIGGPDAAPMAIMSGLAAVVAAGVAAPDAALPTVMAALAIAAVTTGVFLLALGSFRLAAWMRYIPYPVLAGFVAAVGWQLASGGVAVLTGHRLAFAELETLATIENGAHIGVGLAFAAAAVAAQFLTRSHLALPIILVSASILCYAALMVADVDVATARANLWLMTPPDAGGLYWPWAHLEAVDWPALLGGANEIAAGAAIVAINILLNATSLELWSRRSLDLNRELSINGLANIAAGAAGGLAGNISFNRSILNTRSGATGRRAGLISGAVLIGLVAVGPGIVAIVPTPVLGGLLVYLGLSVLIDTFARARHMFSFADYVFLAVLVVLIVRWGYFEGIAAGIVVSCIFFVVRYSRVDVVRHDLTRAAFGSTVDRPRSEAELLRGNGGEMHIMWLRGYLFFGTANRLYATIEKRMLATDGHILRHLALDFSRVSGIDSSAVFSFVKLAHLARDNNATIAFCALSPKAIAAFRGEGLLHASDRAVRSFATLDQGLEWSEDRMLAAHNKAQAAEEPVETWLAEELGSPALATRLLAAVTRVALRKDEALFRQDDPSDSLYLIETGRLAVVMTTADGEQIRLRSMAKHTVLGEMGLYRSLKRTATVSALEPSSVLRLTEATFMNLKSEDPELCDAIHRMVARTLADRLSFANAAVAALQ